jgi:hypothetical protein
MSMIGSSADNALAESFNATFKRETLQGRRAFQGRRGSLVGAERHLVPRRHFRIN